MSLGVFVQVNGDSKWGASRKHLLGYVIQENGCWDWVGSRTVLGYGNWRCDGESFAHRVMYQRAKGSIPDGMVLDHLCRNPSCVNPDHLQAVTQRENLLRGKTIVAKCAEVTACPRGHAYDAANTQWDRGTRQCRTCIRAKNATQYRKRKARKALGGSK